MWMIILYSFHFRGAFSDWYLSGVGDYSTARLWELERLCTFDFHSVCCCYSNFSSDKAFHDGACKPRNWRSFPPVGALQAINGFSVALRDKRFGLPIAKRKILCRRKDAKYVGRYFLYSLLKKKCVISHLPRFVHRHSAGHLAAGSLVFCAFPVWLRDIARKG